MIKSKLTLAFSLLTSLALAGTALADGNHDMRGTDGRVLVQDRRTPPIYQPAPVVVAPPARMFPHAPPIVAQPRWDVLANQATPGRRGTVSIALPARGAYDQLRLVASNNGLDIMAVEISYGRGRSELLKPATDGSVTINLANGKLRSISVRYMNRGAGRFGGGRDASIQVLGKSDAAVAIGGGFGHGHGRGH